jgi:hypothetical protein
MRGQALRYLGRQIMDRTGPRVLVAWVIVAGLCVPLHFAMKQQQDAPRAASLQIVHQLYFQLACLAVVAIFHGIVSDDRVRGYFRFYLAKPVSPLWFYGQSFVLGVLGMAVFTAGFLAIFSLAVFPAWHWQMLTSGLALGLLIGGMIFVLSTLTQRDWIFMILVVILATVLRARFPREGSTLGRVLDAILPPNHLTNELVLTAGQWLWVAGWGVGLAMLGLLILKKRPLGED